MNLLLDTHTFVWALSDPQRIPASTLELLGDMGNTLYVSAVTPFEIATKVRLGKFPEAEALLEGFALRLNDIRAREMPIRSEHAILAGRLNWDHRDPFGRLLAAQSLVENFTLVSADVAFRDVAGLNLLWK